MPRVIQIGVGKTRPATPAEEADFDKVAADAVAEREAREAAPTVEARLAALERAVAALEAGK